jgi:N-methylhydantoinase A
VPLPRRPDPADGPLVAADLAAVQERFAELYEAEYGAGTAWVGSQVVLMSVRVVATGRVPAAEVNPRPVQDRAATPIGSRRVHLAGHATEIDVYDAVTFPVGGRITGPAVLEHPLTTIALPVGWELELDGHGNYLLGDTAVEPVSEDAA